MRIYKIYLIASFVCLITIATLWVFGPPENIIGAVHPEFLSMSQGDNSNQDLNSLTLSLVFGISLFALLAISLFIGLGKRINQKAITILIICSFVLVIVLTSIFFSYKDYIQSEELNLVHGFPLPTLLIIYGIWFYPIVFTLLYVINFKQWVISPEEIEHFEQRISINDDN